MPSNRFGIRLFVGFSLGLGVACSSPTETPDVPENVVAEQPVACDSVTPTYDGYSRYITDFSDISSFQDFSTTATIKQGVAGYVLVLEGDNFPCAVTSPSDLDSCNRLQYIAPLKGTVAVFADPATAEAHCVAKTETDLHGAYQLELEPGGYTFQLLDEKGFPKNKLLYAFLGTATTELRLTPSGGLKSGRDITNFHLLEENRSSAPAFR